MTGHERGLMAWLMLEKDGLVASLVQDPGTMCVCLGSRT